MGLFFSQRLGTITNGPLTVNFSIGGTASNGVDYLQITNSVTMATGVAYAQILVQPYSGVFAGTNGSVVLTLGGGSYLIDPNY